MKTKGYTIKRLALGWVVMTLVSIALAFIPPVFTLTFDPDQFFLTRPMPLLEQSLKIAIAAFAGAYVARVPFVMATIVYFAGATLFVFYALVLIAEPAQPVTMFQVAAMNAIDSAVSLVAAVIGAEFGHRVALARHAAAYC